jgi:hypothetical protein
MEGAVYRWAFFRRICFKIFSSKYIFRNLKHRIRNNHACRAARRIWNRSWKWLHQWTWNMWDQSPIAPLAGRHRGVYRRWGFGCGRI